ncbi:MAG: hypothetical protein MZV70_75980 [Desulfobacterales bacterium]|nr:hypothetical protein [Desulfobacterales bacterium]
MTRRLGDRSGRRGRGRLQQYLFEGHVVIFQGAAAGRMNGQAVAEILRVHGASALEKKKGESRI